MEKCLQYTMIFIGICFLIYFYLSHTMHDGDRELKRVEIPKYITQKRFVKYSINKSKCDGFARLKKVLLTLNFNFPHYGAIPLLKEFYQPVFGKVVFCGSEESKKFDVIKIRESGGAQGFECVATAIRMFPNYDGYIHSNDDVILNWWNLLKIDTNKIWLGNPLNFKIGHIFGEKPDNWHWWKTANAAVLCEKAFDDVTKLATTRDGIELEIPHCLNQYFVNTNGTKICLRDWSDFFYIPRHLSQLYANLSHVYHTRGVFLEVAVPTILTFLVSNTNFVSLNGLYYFNQYGYRKKFTSGEAFYETYSFTLNFSHPFKLEGQMPKANTNFFKNVIMEHGNWLKEYCGIFK